jgi:DNA processing protein
VTDERLARAALCRLTEPADTRVTRALAQVGAVRLYEDVLERRSADDLVADAAGRMTTLDPARELEQAASLGIRFVIPGDPEWPTQLDDLDHAPAVSELGGSPIGLWVRGPLRLDEISASVAVVGSRSATAYGESVARELGAGVARAGRCLVSGAAFGIDQAAHRGALAVKGPTVAVLACGVDRPYPAAHRMLLDYIAETGLVVSELPLGAAPTRVRFLARNRLIAALTRGTVVVEAALRSGALNTANWAERLNRVLMGVPGPVTSAPSEGVHELIRTRGASLVTRGEDVLELVAPSGSFLGLPPRGPVRASDALTDRERQVLDAVPVRQPAGCVSIARTAGIGEPEVTGVLGRLTASGLIEQGDGGWRRAGGGALR